MPPSSTSMVSSVNVSGAFTTINTVSSGVAVQVFYK